MMNFIVRSIHLPALLFAVAVLDACNPRSKPPERVAAVDTTIVSTVTTTDTFPPRSRSAEDTTTAAAENREPDDHCRYADARRQARSGDPNYGEPYDTAAMSRGISLRCALRPGGPEVRVVVGGGFGIPMGVDIYSPPDATRPMQRLYMVDNDERAHEGSPLAHGVDLNRDGWTDLKVQTWSGSAGISYDLFMYDPARRRFVQDSVLKGGGGLGPIKGEEPCVWSSYRSGAGNFSSSKYCWRGGHWVYVLYQKQEIVDAPGNPRYELTIQRPRNGRMVTVSVDTSDHDAAADP